MQGHRERSIRLPIPGAQLGECWPADGQAGLPATGGSGSKVKKQCTEL